MNQPLASSVMASPPNLDVRGLVSRVFGEPLFNTDGDVAALAFAADDTLWSVEEPGLLRRWNPTNGRQLERYFLSDLETLWVFSNDARLLAAASDDLALWDVRTGKQLATLPQPSWVSAATFRGDQKIVATGHDDGWVRLWDVANQELVREVHGHKLPISALAFSADGAFLASAGEDRVILLWNLADGRLLGSLAGHTDRIPALAWHPRGQLLVSAGWDTTARVWNTSTCEPVILLNSHADQVTALTFSRDGRFLATADSANAIHIWNDLPTGQCVHQFKDHTDEIRCLAFSKNGQYLASAGVSQSIHLWDAHRGQLLIGQYKPLQHALSPVASGGPGRLASTCGGMALRIWDPATGRAVFKAETEGGFQAVAASPDGQWIAGGGLDGLIHLWDAQTGEPRGTLRGQSGAVSALVFSSDSTTLASGCASDGTVWLWNLASAEPSLLIIEAADGCTVEAVAFHPQGRLLACGGFDWLATSGSDGAICVWDREERRKVGLFEIGTTCLAFHPSGQRLAAASLSESVFVCAVPGNNLLQQLTGHTDAVRAVAYSPDSRWLASGGDDRTVRLWDADSGAAVADREIDTPIMSLCFSPDSQQLFTGNGNTTCYQIAVETLVRR